MSELIDHKDGNILSVEVMTGKHDKIACNVLPMFKVILNILQEFEVRINTLEALLDV